MTVRVCPICDIADCATHRPSAQPIDPAAIREAALQARIEELVEERDIARRLLGAATQMQKETEAKLTKAVEALRKIADHKHFSWDQQGWIQNTEARIASAALVELGETE